LCSWCFQCLYIFCCSLFILLLCLVFLMFPVSPDSSETLDNLETLETSGTQDTEGRQNIGQSRDSGIIRNTIHRRNTKHWTIWRPWCF
jgi:hypothetical protein